MIQMKLKEYNFNSQPHEEADGRLSRNFFRQSNFNSQPHEEADTSSQLLLSGLPYFNSQPHEEADQTAKLKKPPDYHFNSQPHEEADPRTGHAVCRLLVISTHSLTRRLTPHTFRENVIKNNFNSQPHEEADVELVEMLSRHYPFQLTASRGG